MYPPVDPRKAMHACKHRTDCVNNKALTKNPVPDRPGQIIAIAVSVQWQRHQTFLAALLPAASASLHAANGAWWGSTAPVHRSHA
jgi:hypothetical protein